MKNRYFKYVNIDWKILLKLVKDHPALKQYVHPGEPFPVRVCKDLYVGLIHTIVGQNETNEQTIIKWNQLNEFVKKVKPKRVNNLTFDILVAIFEKDKASLIKQITEDVVSKKLNLKQLAKQPEIEIQNVLSKYQGLDINTIKTFILFTCFKQNVLCNEDPDFIKGLQIFLNKQNISEEDINNIKIEYEGQLTLFSLCMWKIRNERGQ